MKYERYAQEGHEFLKNVAFELGEVENTDQADRIMTSVLYTLRDLLTPEESLHLISQMPMMVKAIYVNGWRLHAGKRMRTIDEFVATLKQKSPRTVPHDFPDDETAIQRTKAVFRAVRNQIADGEVKDIAAQLPPELAELWLQAQEIQERHGG